MTFKLSAKVHTFPQLCNRCTNKYFASFVVYAKMMYFCKYSIADNSKYNETNKNCSVDKRQEL